LDENKINLTKFGSLQENINNAAVARQTLRSANSADSGHF